MYEVDEKDRVVTLEGVPKSCAGAPSPLIVANERLVVIAYYLRSDPSEGISSVVGATSYESIAIVRFAGYTHMFGPPNDEAFSGHPLASRGLKPYGAFRIEYSSWIRTLEKMNRVHLHHNPARFLELQHFIFTFHDSTFECIAKSYDVRTLDGLIPGAILSMVEALLEGK